MLDVVWRVCGVLRMRCGAAVARGVGAAWRVWCMWCDAAPLLLLLFFCSFFGIFTITIKTS